MANNLFISYDLNSPGQNYDSLIDEIKTLGNWAKVQKSFWYVNSSLSATAAKDRLLSKIDRNDSLIVIDSTNNNAAWYGLTDEVASYIRDHWGR